MDEVIIISVVVIIFVFIYFAFQILKSRNKKSVEHVVPKSDEAHNQVLWLRSILEVSTDNPGYENAKQFLEEAERDMEHNRYTAAIENAKRGKEALKKYI
ncbi:MAG: hypothetical protein ACP5RS_05435 [Thermoplasmata archaeon]